MDANKLGELRRIGYQIPRTCGLCKHGVFANNTNEWGTCAVRTYDHQKHTEAKRQLSIYKGGSCPDKFEPKENLPDILQSYQEFVPV